MPTTRTFLSILLSCGTVDYHYSCVFGLLVNTRTIMNSCCCCHSWYHPVSLSSRQRDHFTYPKLPAKVLLWAALLSRCLHELDWNFVSLCVWSFNMHIRNQIILSFIPNVATTFIFSYLLIHDKTGFESCRQNLQWKMDVKFWCLPEVGG